MVACGPRTPHAPEIPRIGYADKYGTAGEPIHLIGGLGTDLAASLAVAAGGRSWMRYPR